MIYFRNLLVVFFLIFCNQTLAKDSSISKKLWNIEFNNKEKKAIKNIFQAIEDKKYQKALKLSSKFNKPILHNAFKAIIYRNRISELDLEKINSISKKYPFFNQNIINDKKEKYIINNNLTYEEIKENHPTYFNSNDKNFLIYLMNRKK